MDFSKMPQNISSVYLHIINISEMSNGSKLDTGFESFYEISQLITGLALYPLICIFGISGSIFTLVILNQWRIVTSTSVFLSALAVADLIRLLNDALYFIFSVLRRTNPEAGNRMMGYMYPFSHYILNQSVCVSSWLTVCIGVERYLYVCHASRVKQWCTAYKAKIISWTMFITMSMIAIPSALRYEGTLVYDITKNSSMYVISLTELGQNKYFTGLYIWTINLLRSVIPLCLLVVLNTCIIQSLRKQKIRGKISGSNRITFMLIIVIVVFVVCITPDAIMSTVFGLGYVEASFLVKGIREFTDTLLAVNSAINFTIYCLCSQTFRDTFNEVFCQSSRQLRHNFHARKSSQCPLLNTSPFRSNISAHCVNDNLPLVLMKTKLLIE